MVVYLVMEGGINIIRVLHKNMDVEQQLEQSIRDINRQFT